MNQHLNQSVATQKLAHQQQHHDMLSGQGVIPTPSHDSIAKRAFDIYIKSGSKPGHCSENWKQAETELRTTNRQL